MERKSKLDSWDFVAVAAYFAAVLGAGLYSMCRSNRGTVSGYFLAGRFMLWLPVGASLFASNIGSEHFIGLAGSGAASGIAVGAFELNACILLQLLGWVFLPVYIASGVCTLPEFMKKRYGGTRIRIYLATLSLILYIFTKVSVNLYSGALFIQQALNWNIYVSIFLLLAATAFCTVTGGLAAVIYTDTLQAFVMVIGALILMIISFVKVGGYSQLYTGYMQAIPNTTLVNPNMTCGYPREDSWIMLRDPAHSDMPWPAFLLGQTPASIWYWCADQMMVQRALAAKSLSHAQGGTLFAGFLKLFPLWIIVIPGMISRVLFTDEVACVDPDYCEYVCQNRVGCSNIAYPKLILELMPSGLRGVMLSVMLAALMSDLTSIFNSASTLFTMDIYCFIRRKASVRELMYVGRGFVVLMVFIGIVWIPVISGMQGAQLFIYIQVISAYLAPPIAAVYCITILWKRANEPGAFWGLMIGLLVGGVRMILDFIYREPNCGEEDQRPWKVLKLHYMYFATFLFWLTGITMVIVSLITKPHPEHQTIRVTFWTRKDRRIRDDETIGNEDAQALKGKDGEPLEEATFTKMPTVANNVTDTLQDSVAKNTNDETELVLIAKSRNVEPASEKPDKNAADVAVVQPNKPKSGVRRAFDWFCGFDESDVGIRKQEELEAHLRKITSLKQDRRAVVALTIGLVVLISLDVFLYLFFSTGSSFGLL